MRVGKLINFILLLLLRVSGQSFSVKKGLSQSHDKNFTFLFPWNYLLLDIVYFSTKGKSPRWIFVHSLKQFYVMALDHIGMTFQFYHFTDEILSSLDKMLKYKTDIPLREPFAYIQVHYDICEGSSLYLVLITQHCHDCNLIQQKEATI